MERAAAIARLERQIHAIEAVGRQPRFSPAFKKWKRDTEVAIEHIFPAGTRHLIDFSSVNYSLSAFSSGTPDSEFDRRFIEGLADAKSVLGSFIDEIEEYGTVASAADGNSSLVLVETLCDRFHLMARALRARHDDRQTIEVEDEYDVQDLLRALLLVHFDDVRTEEWTPSYAGGSARMDFLLKAEGIVVEIKKTRKGLGPKDVGDELLVDIARYGAHPDCKTLVCFVYDPEGRIGTPMGLERDLTALHGSVAVRVIIAPKGL